MIAFMTLTPQQTPLVNGQSAASGKKCNGLPAAWL